MSKLLIFLIMTGLMFSAPVSAEGLNFSLPLKCTLGKDCWIARYNDVDPAKEKYADFTCARRTSDGHEGIDFAIRSRLEMNKGVEVVAAADGRIMRLRDGESDSIKSEDEIKAISAANKDCGNGVIIQHQGGMQSFYCHLKAGSIVVQSGDQVSRGQKIGQVGQSGAAEYPHLHFTVIGQKGRIEPFTGLGIDQGCREKGTPMWEPEIPYQDFAVYDGGFLNEVPNFKEIEKGQDIVKTLPAASEQIIFWVGFYHGQAGDRIDMKIIAPDGTEFAQNTTTMKKDRARQYLYTGMNLKHNLQPGLYTGKAVFSRAGADTEEFIRKITVD